MGGIDFAGLFKPIIAFFKQPPKDEIQNLKEADHTYIRGHETQRSPCPFLNSLANHGYFATVAAMLFTTNVPRLSYCSLDWTVQQLRRFVHSRCGRYVWSNSMPAFETVTSSRSATSKLAKPRKKMFYTDYAHRPRDGKNITQDKLKAALIVAGNCSHALADVLSSIVKPVLHDDDTFTLVDLRRHNAIEHDSSFTRLDFRQGDNYSFQPHMFRAFLADAKGGPITKDSLALTRARRDKEEKEARVPGLGLRLWVTTWSQTCILLETFGQSISTKDITRFYVEEKLPDWWLDGHPQMTVLGLLNNVAAVFWRHLFVNVPATTLNDPLRGW